VQSGGMDYALFEKSFFCAKVQKISHIFSKKVDCGSKKIVYICHSKICAEISLKFCQQKTLATFAAVDCNTYNSLSGSTEQKLCANPDGEQGKIGKLVEYAVLRNIIINL